MNPSVRDILKELKSKIFTVDLDPEDKNDSFEKVVRFEDVKSSLTQIYNQAVDDAIKEIRSLAWEELEGNYQLNKDYIQAKRDSIMHNQAISEAIQAISQSKSALEKVKKYYV